MELKLMKRAAIWCVGFSLVAMVIILCLSVQRNVAVQETGPEELVAGENTNDGTKAGEQHSGPPEGTPAGSPDRISEKPSDGTAQVEESVQDGELDLLTPLEGEESEMQKLNFSQEESDTSYLRIPLPEGCQAEDITIENYYMDQELWILIDGAEGDFYGENAISGNQETVRQGIYEEKEGGLRLRFKLTGIFEYHTILENQELYISFLSPREVYDRIVVIDPACGGLDPGYTQEELKEKEVNLAIAEKLKEKLDKTDIKAYYTRVDDVNPQEESRIRLANETRADMYVRIELDTDEDSGVYGTGIVYNGDFFIPGFGSPELAELLEEEVVSAIKGKALGIVEAEESETVLRSITVPAVTVKAGYATNKQEAILLVREDYQEKIAEGIYRAILKAYEEIGS